MSVNAKAVDASVNWKISTKSLPRLPCSRNDALNMLTWIIFNKASHGKKKLNLIIFEIIL